MNLFTIAPGVDFLDALADGWLERAGGDPLACADGLFLLPTRRAARALSDAFLRRSAGRALLLPRIAAIGAPDEAPLALAGALALPPAIDPVQRIAGLAKLVLGWGGAEGAPTSADEAWRLAGDLATLIDEAHRAEIDLERALAAAVADDYAEHWGRVLRFLQIVTHHWPAALADMGRIDPADRQVRLLHAQAAAWTAQPPATPVIAAGTTGGIKAVARLLRVIARAEWGTVVLPGLDAELADDVAASHPQDGLLRLLTAIGATPGDVRQWAARPRVSPARAAALNRALLPGQALGQWRTPVAAPEGLWRLDAADEQEEAVAIALVLRDALETPDARAMLVTPDRALAARVGAELARFGVIADDSAGENLADSPPGGYVRLLARAVADGLSPVSLLAVLKHPLSGLGLAPARCRALARKLEIAYLRGPPPPPGLAGLRAKAGGGDAEMLDLLDRLESRLVPLMTIAAEPIAAPQDGLAALLIAAEAMAETDAADGAAILWRHEEGEALAAHLAAVLDAVGVLPAQRVRTLPTLLDATLEGAVVRTRRALRGRPGEEHPRIAILGLLEARLLSADIVVLGGLSEQVWPPATDPGPWMSRPMRAAAGLDSPEDRVGQAAHDFVMTACAAPIAVLSAPRRREGAPAVPARWLVRLEAMLGANRLPDHGAVAWARRLDQPDRVRAVRPPQPRPALDRRPRRLSVTEIGTWQRDPYAIYARHVLALRALAALEETTDHSDYGTIVHAALARFIDGIGHAFPSDAAERCRRAMDAELDAAPIRPALAAWWRPRLHRIAGWVAMAERDRRMDPPAQVLTERRANWDICTASGPFTLRARADRIDVLADGAVSIVDYKTGTVPAAKHQESGLEPQLTLEAAMVAAGAFGPDLAGRPMELAYWRLSGGAEAGAETPLFKRDRDRTAEHVAAARSGLLALVARFDDASRPYLSCPDPNAVPRYSDYTQLARVAEWAESDGSDS